ncbi:MAG: hypothetical protein ACRERE_39710 [Candidatus Entotheonellia bacterium]
MALGLGLRGTVPAEAEKPPASAAAYVLGKLDGALAEELMDVLQPVKWKGQTDGLLIMAGESVHKVHGETERNLLALHAAGHPIVLTNAAPEHFHRLHEILGVLVPVTLREPYDHLDFYAYANSVFGPKAFTMMPLVSAEPLDPPPSETPERKLKRAKELLDWHEMDVRQSVRTGGNPVPGSQGTGGTILEVATDVGAWEIRATYPVSYLWGTCDQSLFGRTYYRDSCQTSYQLYVDVWPVYSADGAAQPGNPTTDYFVMQLSGNLTPGDASDSNSPGDCYGWYTGRSHDDRLSAYWARTYQFTANVAQNAAACTNNPTGGPLCYWGHNDLGLASGYTPQTVNPDGTYTNGTSINLGTTGTAGVDEASIGFSAGAEFTNQTTISYQALEPAATIGGPSGNDSQAVWKFDSWNFVHSSIEPSNNACGGPGLWSDVAAPAIITTASFSPVMTYVWEVSKTMRNTYSTGCVAGAVSCPGGSCPEPSANEAACLPVEVDLGVLLGWAFFPSADDTAGQCNGDTPN